MYKKVEGKWTTVAVERVLMKERTPVSSSTLVQEMLRKYSGPRKKKVKTEVVKDVALEWVDPSFIKEYTSETELSRLLDSIAEEFPTIARRQTVGKSVEGRALTGLVVGLGVREGRPLLRPQVKYVANIHGDEAVGREMLLGLARYLTENYGKDDRVTAIVDHTEVHLLPSINPDGNAATSRHNSHDIDLNRSFPGWRDLGLSRQAMLKGGYEEADDCSWHYTLQEREAEVVGMMNYCLDNSFVLSISFHDGRVMVNYPWDDSPTAEEGHAAVCPDDAVFSELAAMYAEWHTFMWTGKCLCHSETFAKGISNGAEWYLVDNGMQDFNYLFTNCLEITVELSCTKKPAASHLQAEWENNLDPMLAVIEAVQGGVRGVVVDQDGKPLEGAHIQVEGIEKDMRTTSRGEYWRLLLPGLYLIKAVHTSPWGVLESDQVAVEVTEVLGKGALVINFVARIRLDVAFVVTGVKVGGCKFFDHKYISEVALLFKDCRVTKVELFDPECKRVPNSPENRQVAFQVDVVPAAVPMFLFFEERWGEEVVRLPTSAFEATKMARRSKLYAEDRWAGRQGEWNIRLA